MSQIKSKTLAYSRLRIERMASPDTPKRSVVCPPRKKAGQSPNPRPGLASPGRGASSAKSTPDPLKNRLVELKPEFPTLLSDRSGHSRQNSRDSRELPPHPRVRPTSRHVQKDSLCADSGRKKAKTHNCTMQSAKPNQCDDAPPLPLESEDTEIREEEKTETGANSVREVHACAASESSR